jgi:hypothetical protein
MAVGASSRRRTPTSATGADTRRRTHVAASPGKIFRAATRCWIGPLAHTRSIVKVTVRDQNFQIVRVLASEADLAAFRALWSALIEVDPRSWTPAPGQPHQSLIIEWSGRGGRARSSHWFYHPGGFVNLLAILPAIWVAPLYRTPDPEAFEAMLGGGRSDAV